MKLSEVIKAIEDGSKNKFVCEGFEILKSGEDVLICFDKKPMVYVNVSRNFEEVKPPRQWNEKELMLFKLLPDWAKWIAKDKIGTWYAYKRKPISICGIFHSDDEDSNDIIRFGDLGKILTITFEESPVYIGDLKGE